MHRALLLSAILTASTGADVSSAYDVGRILADPVSLLAVASIRPFHGTNTYSVEAGPTGSMLRSTPNGTASALEQTLDIDGRDLQTVRWLWRVDRLHRSADVRDIAREDFGAMVMFVFGDPSYFNRDVPTIAYVWTSTPVAINTILTSVRFRSLRYVQLRSREDAGQWCGEMRNLAADFKAIFGRDPPALRHIAFFNDNDQTKEDASALFGPVEMLRP